MERNCSILYYLILKEILPIFITDYNRLKQKTQWQPTIEPEKTIEDIYHWIVNYEDSLRSILF